jgi:Kdo2-lipid IVA lauroyltransferase/acyltransferase
MECLGHSIIEEIAGRLPGAWVFRLGEFFGGLAWHFMPMRRSMVLRNLRIAMAGEKELPEIEEMAKAAFRRTAGNLISAARTARLSPEKLHDVIHIENRELLEEALAKGKGVVLLLSHMGNWEILSRIVHLFPEGSKTGAFYRPLNNKLLDARILRRRQYDGTRMFSKRDPFHQVTGFLREGGIVGILADQRVGKQGEVVSFFGRLTRASPLPSLLARRAKSEVLALTVSTERPGKWKVTFIPVEAPHNTDHCMAALESGMKANVIDVFWLQERWKVYVKKNRSFQQWLGPGNLVGKKPHRALIWLVHVPSDWRLPDAWFHPDITYEAAIDRNAEVPDWLPEAIPLHRVDGAKSRREILRELIRIDAAELLPLDFVLCHISNPHIANATAMSIPVVPLS